MSSLMGMGLVGQLLDRKRGGASGMALGAVPATIGKKTASPVAGFGSTILTDALRKRRGEG